MIRSIPAFVALVARPVTVSVFLLGMVSPLQGLERELMIEFESPLLATRGDARVSHLEFDARMQAIPQKDRAGVVSDPDRIGQLIADLLVTRELASRAIDEGLLDDPLIHAELYHLIAVRLSERYQRKVVADAELDDYTNSAREIYLTNPDRFRTDPTVTFRHILIGSQQDDAGEQAETILAELRDGAAFETLASEHSDDPSVAQNNGRLEQIAFGDLEPAFRAGIEAMAPGEPGIVESAYGWHVVEVEETFEPRLQEFDEVADELRQEAREAHRGEVWGRVMREIYNPELEIEEGGIAEVLERFPPPELGSSEARSDSQVSR